MLFVEKKWDIWIEKTHSSSQTPKVLLYVHTASNQLKSPDWNLDCIQIREQDLCISLLRSLNSISVHIRNGDDLFKVRWSRIFSQVCFSTFYFIQYKTNPITIFHWIIELSPSKTREAYLMAKLCFKNFETGIAR